VAFAREVNDFARRYWASQKTTPPPDSEEPDGFEYPFALLVEGWLQRNETGVTPHPDEIARMPQKWRDELNLLGRIVARAKPRTP